MIRTYLAQISLKELCFWDVLKVICKCRGTLLLSQTFLVSMVCIEWLPVKTISGNIILLRCCCCVKSYSVISVNKRKKVPHQLMEKKVTLMMISQPQSLKFVMENLAPEGPHHSMGSQDLPWEIKYSKWKQMSQVGCHNSQRRTDLAMKVHCLRNSLTWVRLKKINLNYWILRIDHCWYGNFVILGVGSKTRNNSWKFYLHEQFLDIY